MKRLSERVRFVAASAVAFICVCAAFAAPPKIEIVAEAGSGKDPISLSEVATSGDAARLFLKVLADDLQNSGWFVLGSGGYESMRLSGRVSGAGARLSTDLRFTWPSGSFVWRESTSGAREARWQAHRLSDEIVRRTHNRIGIASTRIALIGKRQGSGDLYVCDYDGSGLAQLTSDNCPALSPYFHPDGTHIFYTSFLRGCPAVYRAPVNGGVRSPYARFPGLNTGGAVSPDGRLLAVILSKDGNPELYVLNTVTHVATRQTHTVNAAEASPCWSPDGSQIAYVSDETSRPHIYVMNSSNKTARRISIYASENVAPSWSPDGRIAYCAKTGGSYQIAVYDPSDGTTKIVSSGPDHEDPSWAPDGRHIICSRKEGHELYSICILDTEGDNPVILQLPRGDWHSPDWSRPIAR